MAQKQRDPRTDPENTGSEKKIAIFLAFLGSFAWIKRGMNYFSNKKNNIFLNIETFLYKSYFC